MQIRRTLRYDRAGFRFSALMLLCAMFFVTKMIRAFSGSNTEGGIWNYIQILFVLFGALAIVKFRASLLNGQIFTLLLYSLLCLINALPSVSFNRESIFGYLMIAYPVCILAVMSRQTNALRVPNNYILQFTFYVIAFIYCASMLRPGIYSTTTGLVADSYYVLGLLPLVLCYQKRMLWLPISVCGITILLSGKRAGLVAYIVMVISYYIIEAIRANKARKAIRSIFSFIIIIILFIFVFRNVASIFNLKFESRIRNMILYGEDSGRTVRWATIWHAMKSSSMIQWVFGHGCGAVTHFIGGNAHNDFFEILYNYGILPFIFYVAFQFEGIVRFLRMLKERYIYAAQYCMTVLYSWVIAFFSFFIITPTYITCAMMCFGLINADYDANQKLKDGIIT